MRYTIYSEITDKETQKKYCGPVVIGKYGCPYILTSLNSVKESLMDDNKKEEFSILVFTNAKEAELYCQILTRSYRRDDVAFYPSKKSKKIRKFFPVKIDSSKFPCLIEKADNKDRFISKNRFNEKQVSSMGTYHYYRICGIKT